VDFIENLSIFFENMKHEAAESSVQR